ncbi:MAG: transcription-repair coupling factor [Nitrospinota bacterium]|nr:transcription-repair coupling factor [Nitrospinota bacterium]
MTINLSLEGVLARLRDSSALISLNGLTLPVKALVVSALAKRIHRPLVVVEDKESRAEEFHEALSFFLPGSQKPRLMRFPAWETLPYDDLSPHPATSGLRLETINDLAQGSDGFIMTTSVEALLRRVVPPAEVKKATMQIKAGSALDLEKLSTQLARTGYKRCDLTEEPGEFSIRGGIMDIYPGAARGPFRLELFGDSVESIRRFDPATQRSAEGLVSIVIPPFREVFYSSRHDPAQAFADHMSQSGALQNGKRITELLRAQTFFAGMESLAPFFFDGLDSMFDVLPPEVVFILDEEEDIFAHLAEFEELVEEEHQERVSTMTEVAPCRPGTLFLGREEVEEKLASGTRLSLRELAMEGEGEESVTIHTSSTQRYLGDVARFTTDLEKMIQDGYTVALAASTRGGAERMEDLLKERDFGAKVVGEKERVKLFEGLLDPQALLFENRLFILEGAPVRGFIIPPGKWAVITEDEIFGKTRKAKRRAVPVSRVFTTDLLDLKLGDIVTHKVHGVGKYIGVREMTIADTADEYLEIEYAQNQRLYLPIHGIDMIDRYMGSGGVIPPLDRMGGVTWKKTRGRVRKDLMEMAGELMKIQAARELAQGHAFSRDGQFHHEFADTFEFSETEDQLAAIEDVTADMEKQKPMDRLVCGDVGYGKTEVALRAAFKAAYDGKQVAVLAPTTLLVQQHFQTFSERLRAFPVTVESVSRFKRRKEQLLTLERAARGDVDILIGTHRLLQKDVAFKNLGLVIVDEEQRFGVRNKEKLKTMMTGVDTLILTATPIPRTLHTSLMGIKELSVIETPPVDRQAIRTFTAKFSDKVIRDSIMRELDRGGQTFFVHNKVRSIHSMARYLGKVVPEARVGVAHGQMRERELEEVMLDFVDRKLDVLLATTIIESGLDIPSANTILINRADQLGLSQLYQLRGRVGRERHRAYCYFMVPGGTRLKPAAKKRLKALEELTELGGGFKLAARDMEIRGAGNLLGSQQSGHIDAVGFETYRRMVEDAVRELKGEPPKEEFGVELSVGFFGKIPVEYVPGVSQRMELYGKINGAADAEALELVEAEMRDRFGPPPDETRALLAHARIKSLCRALKIEKVDMVRDRLYLVFAPSTHLSPATLVTASYERKESIRFVSENTVEYKLAGGAWQDRARKMSGFLSFLLEKSG